jgi:hypothetical protein
VTPALLVAVLAALLTGIVGKILISELKFSRLTTARGEIQRDARMAIDLINRNLRQGKAASVAIARWPNNASSAQPPCSMISFTHVNGKNYSFYQKGDKLFMSVNGVERELAKNLRVLLFTYPRTDDATIISVSVCFEKATYEGSSKTLQLSVEKVRVMN